MRYINHGIGKDKNTRAVTKLYRTVIKILFYAERDIKKGEELFYDYSYSEDTKPEWMKEYERNVRNAKNRRREPEEISSGSSEEEERGKKRKRRSRSRSKV